MGRGGRKNRKRRRDEDSAQLLVSESLPRLDVSFWKGEATATSPSLVVVGGDAAARVVVPPPPALQTQQLLTQTTSETPPDWDSATWHALQSTWWSLQRRHHSVLWTEPTPIQLQSWPVLLQQSQNYNLIQVSPTGSGKTLAYGLPMVLQLLHQLNNHSSEEKEEEEIPPPPPMGLCLVPTRELAIQVQKAIQEVVKCCGVMAEQEDRPPQTIQVVACHGGVDKQAQLRALAERGNNNKNNNNNIGFIVAATTGRLLDILSTKNDTMNEKDDQLAVGSAFRNVRMLILDEADRMALNRDLCEQVNQILELVCSRADSLSTLLASNIPTVLCSATWPDRVTETWRQWVHATIHKPCVVVKIDGLVLGQKRPANNQTSYAETAQDSPQENSESGKTTASVDSKSRALLLSQIPANLTQTLHVCAEHKKARKLLTTLQNVYGSQNDNKRSRTLGIVFCATIQKVQYLAKFLTKECSNRNNVIPSSAQLHSRLAQVDRERVVREFTCGKVPLLLATDLASRGLDVRSVSLIVNYDFPSNLEQYVHRCGRAGRGGSTEVTATVHSFFTRNLAPLAADVVALLEAGQQVVDPNLRALVAVDLDRGATRPAAKRVKRRADRKSAEVDDGLHNTNRSENSDDDSTDDMFQHLSAKRIVLTRAPGISDPSSSDDDNSS